VAFAAVLALRIFDVSPLSRIVSNPQTRRTVKGLRRQTVSVAGMACCRVTLPKTFPSIAKRRGEKERHLFH
jgi:hypothetical protein